MRPGSLCWMLHNMAGQLPATKQLSERKITAVNGNTISVDIPVMDPMEIQYGGGEVFKSNITGRISESGIENMRLESDFEGDSDENHGWNGIQLNRAENCWVRDVIVKVFRICCCKPFQYEPVHYCSGLRDDRSEISNNR